jgi:hypothetical protein
MIIAELETKCITCGSEKIIKHGKTANGTIRLRCKDCNKTWAANKMREPKPDIHLLTAKPVMYVCNVDEASVLTGNKYVDAVKEAIKNVSEIQADGDELDIIHSWGYPNHGKRVQRYIGETAQQILLNW